VAAVSARSLALAGLRAWDRRRQSADKLFGELTAEVRLSPADRAFALELFYGALRNLTLLDFWIDQLRSGRMDASVHHVLRLGLYQIFIAKIPEHAAVFETVRLAGPNARGFVNAILRTATRKRRELAKAAGRQPLHVQMSHPEFLINRWTSQYGAVAAMRLCEWNNAPPSIYARINRLRIDPDRFHSTYRETTSLRELPDFVEFTKSFPAAALNAGHCYVQDPSTRLAVEQLAARPGEIILDACAAPGGKTAFIAEAMQNQGRIVAVDRKVDRVRLLKENLDRLGVTVASSIQHDWMHPAPPEILAAGLFDRVLLDAPCTNTGVMRRRVDVRWRLRPGDFDRMQKQQLSIARAVLPLIKPGGTFVYSTCSLEAEENEQLVRVLLEQGKSLELVNESASLPFRDQYDGAYIAKFTVHPG
jgi:16S rRNA (cytosine967-C5)-methyltransferase